ncbi:MAG: hypothetical protein Q4A92_00580 [Corynebacterium sp.]|nr:hypothetical protein [Corynebacterium sp.]
MGTKPIKVFGVGVILISAGAVLVGCASEPEAYLFDRLQAGDTEISVMAMPGGNWAEYAIVCPNATPQLIADATGWEVSGVPQSGLAADENILILHADNGAMDAIHLDRKSVDLCPDIGEEPQTMRRIAANESLVFVRGSNRGWALETN